MSKLTPEQLQKELDKRVKKTSEGTIMFFRSKDTELIRAFLAQSPNDETRFALKSMISASLFGASCQLGRIFVYPNHWKNGIWVKVASK